MRRLIALAVVVTAVPALRMREIIASREEASPTTTPEVEPTACAMPTQASGLVGADEAVAALCARAPIATRVVALPAGSSSILMSGVDLSVRLWRSRSVSEPLEVRTWTLE